MEVSDVLIDYLTSIKHLDKKSQVGYHPRLDVFLLTIYTRLGALSYVVSTTKPTTFHGQTPNCTIKLMYVIIIITLRVNII
jgi:hypothetical protein